jgi:pyridoxine 5-phosphate synthase
MPVKLSVNINKVATLRNSRGGDEPNLVAAMQVVVAAGAPGVTLHPRADERHIRARDVYDVAAAIASLDHPVELNIEGDPRPGLLALVHDVRPTQCTLVPVKPGEITSQAGWPPDTPRAALAGAIADMRAAGIRVSLFVDAAPDAVRWAAGMGADRIEIYTEPFAHAYAFGDPLARREAFAACAAAAELAHDLGLGVNAGHDLNLDNLALFCGLPHLAEVSIGHALISHALFVGLDRAVRDYLEAVAGTFGRPARPGL